MNIAEAKSARRAAETQVFQALRELQCRTGLSVENVRLVYEHTIGKNDPGVIDVHIDTVLGRD